jgi:hypothetical protein
MPLNPHLVGQDCEVGASVSLNLQWFSKLLPLQSSSPGPSLLDKATPASK